MAYNQQNAFWDWVRTQSSNEANHNGEGVDRPAQPNIPGSWPGGAFGYGNSYGPLFGGHWPFPPPPPPPGHEGPPPPPPHHGHGPGGHHHHGPPPPPPPPEFGAGFPFGGGLFGWPGPHHHGGGLFGGPPRGGWHGRGGRRGRCGRREGRHGDRHRDENEEAGEGQQQGFDLSALLASLASHPLAQPYRQFFENLASQGQQSGETARGDNVEDENTFTPPLDIFTIPTEYVLHVALPGAKKEDVGINWDAEKGVLNIAGVVYRQGDEEFLKMLSKSERRVGVFERALRLPPVGEGEEEKEKEKEKEEIDGDGITAKLEDGVLVVRVPKVEKEWTDVKKVDIL